MQTKEPPADAKAVPTGETAYPAMIEGTHLLQGAARPLFAEGRLRSWMFIWLVGECQHVKTVLPVKEAPLTASGNAPKARGNPCFASIQD